MLKISKKYAPLFDLPKAKERAKETNEKYWQDLAGVSIVIITGGRNSVKSFAAGLSQVDLCVNHGYNVFSTRFTNVSMAQSVIPEIKEKVDLLGYHDFIEVQQNMAVARQGRKDENYISFRGLKPSQKSQTGNLKSLKAYSAWFIEEGEEFNDFETFDKAYLSIRGKDGKQVFTVFVMNPASKEHFVFKHFFEDRGVPEGWNGIKDEVLYIHTTYKDCPVEFIPPNIYKRYEAERELYLRYKAGENLTEKELQTVHRFRHIVLGGWLDKAEGVIFENWEYGEFDTSLPYLFGLDFGFSNDPDALVKVAIDSSNRKIYVKQLIYRNGLGTHELSQLIKSNPDAAGSTIIADSSEQRLIFDLQRTGIKVAPVVKFSGSVLSGIKLLKNFEIIVDPDSTEIGKELNNYVWADKKIEVPVDLYNHAIDAIRYAVQTALNYRETKVY